MLLRYDVLDRYRIKTRIISVTSDERMDVESVRVFPILTTETHMSLIQTYTPHTHTSIVSSTCRNTYSQVKGLTNIPPIFLRVTLVGLHSLSRAV